MRAAAKVGIDLAQEHLPGNSGGAFDNVALSGGPYEPTRTTRLYE